jgi:hypothetical protein
MPVYYEYSTSLHSLLYYMQRRFRPVSCFVGELRDERWNERDPTKAGIERHGLPRKHYVREFTATAHLYHHLVSTAAGYHYLLKFIIYEVVEALLLYLVSICKI